MGSIETRHYEESRMSQGIIADALNKALEAKLPKEDVSAHRALTWLTSKIAQGRKGPFAEEVTVTPEIAQRLLDNNPDNRKLKERMIRAMVADLKAGRWQANGETIKLSIDGELNDGQNRLTAVVRSGASLRTWVVFGLPRETRMTIDTGAVRTGADFLGMGNVKNAVAVAGVSRQLMLYRRGQYFVGGARSAQDNDLRDAPTKAEINDFYWKHHKVIDRSAAVAHNTKFMTAYSVPAIGTAHIVLSALNPAATDEFFARFNDGVGLQRGNPILAFRAHVMAMATEKKLIVPQKLELIFRYWNAWRSGKSLNGRIRPVSSWPKPVA